MKPKDKGVQQDIYTFYSTSCVSHPVVSSSLGPHGLQPASLLCPWNLQAGYWSSCHFLLQGIFPTQGSNQVSPMQTDSLLSEPPGNLHSNSYQSANVYLLYLHHYPWTSAKKQNTKNSFMLMYSYSLSLYFYLSLSHIYIHTLFRVPVHCSQTETAENLIKVLRSTDVKSLNI